MSDEKNMPSEEKAQLLRTLVEDKKAENPILLDLRGKVLVADFFLICSGLSDVQIRAMAEAILEEADHNPRLNKPRIEGWENAEWILLDFGDVVLHIMDEETRERYHLEKFWSSPQPKGALPPTPNSPVGITMADDLADAEEDQDDDPERLDEEDWDASDPEEDDPEDSAFFADADTEVAPLEEDAVDSELDAEGYPRGA